MNIIFNKKKLSILILFLLLCSSVVFTETIDINLNFDNPGDKHYNTASQIISDALVLSQDEYETGTVINIYASIIQDSIKKNDITLTIQLEGEDKKVLINKGKTQGTIFIGEAEVPCSKDLSYFVDASLSGTTAEFSDQTNLFVYNIEFLFTSK
ncbi:MAG: hypothetical protein ACOCRK_05970 [bacterium]